MSFIVLNLTHLVANFDKDNKHIFEFILTRQLQKVCKMVVFIKDAVVKTDNAFINTSNVYIL